MTTTRLAARRFEFDHEALDAMHSTAVAAVRLTDGFGAVFAQFRSEIDAARQTVQDATKVTVSRLSTIEEGNAPTAFELRALTAWMRNQARELSKERAVERDVTGDEAGEDGEVQP